jgi:hypothetical protein
MVKAFFEANPVINWGLYVLIIGGVLGAGYLVQKRRGQAQAQQPASSH